MENKNEKEDKKEENEKEEEDKKDEKNEEGNDKKYKKNKIKNLIKNIDNNYKQDSTTFLENLKMFDKNFKKEKEKVPNINNRFPENLNQIKNTEDDLTMNVNKNLIDNPYPNLDINPFRQNGDYLKLAQNQEQKTY